MVFGLFLSLLLTWRGKEGLIAILPGYLQAANLYFICVHSGFFHLPAPEGTIFRVGTVIKYCIVFVLYN